MPFGLSLNQSSAAATSFFEGAPQTRHFSAIKKIKVLYC